MTVALLHRRITGTLGALALAAPAVLGLTAGTALAAGSFTSPTPDNGSTLSGSFQVKAATTARGTTVSLSGPGGYSASKTSSTSVTSSTNQTITLDSVDPGRFPNGTWTAKVSGGETRSFYANFGTATPSGFTASTTQGDAHDVDLSWDKGSEPDLTGYTLYAANGNVLQSGISPSSACDGSSCHYSLYYDNPDPGTYSYGYQLTASRAGGCASGSCPDVESDKTGVQSATLTTPKPPKPSPTPTPQPTQAGGSTGGSTSGSTGGSTSGGSSSTGGSTSGGSTSGGTTGGTSSTGTGTSTGTGAGTVTAPSAGPLPTLNPDFNRRATALGFSQFSANLGIPKLPPLPDTTTTVTLPGAPAEGAEQTGTYDPTLPYKSVAAAPEKSSSSLLTPLASSIGVDTQKLAQCLAIALILIMTAAHLRRWIGAHAES